MYLSKFTFVLRKSTSTKQHFSNYFMQYLHTWISDWTSNLLFTRSTLDLLSLPPSHHVQRCPLSRRSWAFSCPKVGTTKGQDGAHYSHALHEGFKQQLVEVKWRPSNNHLERKRTELPEHQEIKKPIRSDRLAYFLLDTYK